MKKIAFLALTACMIFTSCEKIVGDLDFLDHDMEIQGTVNPTLGVPVAHGSVSVYDLLQMVQVTEATIEIGNDNIVTIVYDTNIEHRVAIDNDGKAWRKGFRKNHYKATNYVDTAHNSIQGAVKVDIFDNIDSSLNGASIEVDNLFVNIGAFVIAESRENALNAMNAYHVTVFYDSLFLSAIGKDGSEQRVDLPNVVPVDSLIQGQYIKLFDKEDISQVINKRPVEIRYGVRMNIAFAAEFYETDVTASEFVADSVGIDSVNIDADIKVEFPVSTSIRDLTYNTDLKFAPSFNLGDLSLDESMLILYCDNGLPLALDLTAALIDSTGNELCKILDPTPTTLNGAPVGSDGNGHISAVGKSHTELKVPITASVFDNILKTKGIRIEAVLNTTPTGSATNNKVAIKSNDMLDILVTAKIKPSYPFSYDLNNNNNNSSKGGQK